MKATFPTRFRHHKQIRAGGPGLKLHEPQYFNEDTRHNLRLITEDTRERRDLKIVAGRGSLEFHFTLGGHEAVAVQVAVRGETQRRAAQAALAWFRCCWLKDRRSISILEVELCD